MALDVDIMAGTAGNLALPQRKLSRYPVYHIPVIHNNELPGLSIA